MKPYDPFKDLELITEYCEFYEQDFFLWCSEKGIGPDYFCDHELDYCEAMEEHFIEYSKKHLRELELNEADRKNDEDKADSIE